MKIEEIRDEVKLNQKNQYAAVHVPELNFKQGMNVAEKCRNFHCYAELTISVI